MRGAGVGEEPRLRRAADGALSKGVTEVESVEWGEGEAAILLTAAEAPSSSRALKCLYNFGFLARVAAGASEAGETS